MTSKDSTWCWFMTCQGKAQHYYPNADRCTRGLGCLRDWALVESVGLKLPSAFLLPLRRYSSDWRESRVDSTKELCVVILLQISVSAATR